MRSSYTFELRDDDGTGLADLEMKVEYEVTREAGDPYVAITAILMRRFPRQGMGSNQPAGDEVDILSSDEPLLRRLGAYAKAQIEADEHWCEARLNDRDDDFFPKAGYRPGPSPYRRLN